MVELRLSKGIKGIIIPQHLLPGRTSGGGGSRGLTGAVVEVSGGAVAIKPKRKRKKLSKVSRPFEKLTRRLARAQIATGSAYLSRHNRSNRRKRNGWLRDIVDNVMRSSRKGRKALKLGRIL